MTPPASSSFERDLADVRNVGGWVAIVIAALTSNGVAQLVATLLSGDKPKFGLDQAATVVNAFILTAPLSITALLAVLVVARGWLPENPNEAIALAAGLVVAGLVLGSIVYAVLGTEIKPHGSVEATSLQQAIQQGGAIQQRVVRVLLWVIAGYYQIFGPAHFAAGVIAGGFGAYAINKLAFRPS